MVKCIKLRSRTDQNGIRKKCNAGKKRRIKFIDGCILFNDCLLIIILKLTLLLFFIFCKYSQNLLLMEHSFHIPPLIYNLMYLYLPTIYSMSFLDLIPNIENIFSLINLCQNIHGNGNQQ